MSTPPRRRQPWLHNTCIHERTEWYACTSTRVACRLKAGRRTLEADAEASGRSHPCCPPFPLCLWLSLRSSVRWVTTCASLVRVSPSSRTSRGRRLPFGYSTRALMRCANTCAAEVKTFCCFDRAKKKVFPQKNEAKISQKPKKHKIVKPGTFDARRLSFAAIALVPTQRTLER